MLTKVLCLIAALHAQSVLSSRYHGPTALPVVLDNGYLADTHEVAAAKSAHLNTLTHQSHGGSYGPQGDSRYSGQFASGYDHSGGSGAYHGDSRYNGPLAIPHVLHDGHIADTHEVAAAKAEHFTAVAKARAHGGYSHGGDYSGQFASGYDHSGASGAYHGDSRYQGPLAIPHVLHDGHIADTHEVAAAKAEHFTAVAKARVNGGYSHGGDYSSQYASGYEHSGAYYGHGTHASYHGPIAKPVVLPSGHLADTHEVSVSKHQHLQAYHHLK